MSKNYDGYIREHQLNVLRGFDWFFENYPLGVNFIVQSYLGKEGQPVSFGELDRFKNELILKHDKSKFSKKEYDPYDQYFYGEVKDYKTLESFDYAWLSHIHNNPHHWQHWVLFEDEGKTKALDMPYYYAFEMVLDWWAFSWKNNNLTEIFSWYSSHKDKMILSDKTREFVEDLLHKIKSKI